MFFVFLYPYRSFLWIPLSSLHTQEEFILPNKMMHSDYMTLSRNVQHVKRQLSKKGEVPCRVFSAVGH